MTAANRQGKSQRVYAAAMAGAVRELDSMAGTKGKLVGN